MQGQHRHLHCSVQNCQCKSLFKDVIILLFILFCVTCKHIFNHLLICVSHHGSSSWVIFVLTIDYYYLSGAMALVTIVILELKLSTRLLTETRAGTVSRRPLLFHTCFSQRKERELHRRSPQSSDTWKSRVCAFIVCGLITCWVSQ